MFKRHFSKASREKNMFHRTFSRKTPVHAANSIIKDSNPTRDKHQTTLKHPELTKSTSHEPRPNLKIHNFASQGIPLELTSAVEPEETGGAGRDKEEGKKCQENCPRFLFNIPGVVPLTHNAFLPGGQ